MAFYHAIESKCGDRVVLDSNHGCGETLYSCKLRCISETGSIMCLTPPREVPTVMMHTTSLRMTRVFLRILIRLPTRRETRTAEE